MDKNKLKVKNVTLKQIHPAIFRSRVSEFASWLGYTSSEYEGKIIFFKANSITDVIEDVTPESFSNLLVEAIKNNANVVLDRALENDLVKEIVYFREEDK